MGIIRLLLALAVVLAHTQPIFGFTLTGGKVAVQAFFIISGFYMTMILNEKYIKENDSYWLFLSNRLMRLFPVYWVVLLLTIFFSVVLGVFNNKMPVIDIYTQYLHEMDFSSIAYLVLTNIFLFGQDVVMFMGLDTKTGEFFFTRDFRQTQPMVYNFLFVPQAWTIGLELMFYLLAPFLLRRKLWIVAIMILASIALRLLLSSKGLNNDPWSYRFFPTELAFFLSGAISYSLYKRVLLTETNLFMSYMALIFVLCFTLFYSFLPRWFEFNLLNLPFQRKECLYFASFVVLVPLIFQLTKRWRYDIYIGELSYPIYISHMFVLMVVKELELQLNLELGLSVVLGTILISILLNEFVAKKVEVVRQRRVKTINDKSEIKQANAVL